MKIVELFGRGIAPGTACGEALVSRKGISFFGGVDPETGIIVERNHDLEGVCIRDKILVFPTGKGSTVGSYTIYRMKKNHTAPLAIINQESEPITAVGCILAEIPCLDKIPIHTIETGFLLNVDGEQGTVSIILK
jgi:predicted aconitase with swiveling domain